MRDGTEATLPRRINFRGSTYRNLQTKKRVALRAGVARREKTPVSMTTDPCAPNSVVIGLHRYPCSRVDRCDVRMLRNLGGHASRRHGRF